MGYPQNGWLKWMIWGYPNSRKPPYIYIPGTDYSDNQYIIDCFGFNHCFRKPNIRSKVPVVDDDIYIDIIPIIIHCY